MVSLTIDNYRNNRLQVINAVRWNAIHRHMWLCTISQESGYGYQFRCRCICGRLGVCDLSLSKFVYLRFCFTSQAVVYCNHTSNHDPCEAWHQASAVFALAGGAGDRRRGRGPVGMRKRRPNMGLTSPAGPVGEWKAITKGPIPQLITVCYLPELTSKKNWNYRDGKAVLPSLKGSRFFRALKTIE